ncbi:hypothetical protein [Bdellovibrio sp. NC01]|uniref:hypothetical protein n=1 Tax=Bdellovibrio sp. NC01 TaxID=2220073 RepID=UPI00115BA966|nr:hypothetical protein [Bdellovibrio sp. NC01]QDK38172.1 hypothetical protein DOE51_11555 [Bdellovibrio sp. NC01]
MIEIVLGVWFACLSLSAIVVSINFYLTRKQLQSRSLQILNQNLVKIDLFWSNSNADFNTLTENAIQLDARKTLRNTLLVGFLGIASVPGFLLLTAVVLSVRFLARSRKEVATFRSELAERDLSKDEVERLVSELRHIH